MTGGGFTTRPELRGTFGVAASTHWLATAVAMRTLEIGGNAFDAAVAAGFVLQVVEPHLNGPGGEVPVLFWSERERRVGVLCGQGVAPAAATIDAFRALGLPLVPGTGLLAATVPGAFDAWMCLLRDHGTLPLRSVLQPAIDYAAAGYPVVPRISQAITAVAPLFREYWVSSAEVYLPGGEVPRPGRLFSNPALARTYGQLLSTAEAAGTDRKWQIEAARAAWSRGFVADAIDRFCAGTAVLDCSGRAHRGLLRGDDLACWHAGYEEPLVGQHGRWAVAKCGAWSQGPTMLQQLAILDRFDLGALDPCGDEFVHTVVEAGKLSFADRDAWLADPRFADVPLQDLLSDDYISRRASLIGADASTEIRPGSPGGRVPRGPDLEPTSRRLADSASAMFGIGEPTFARLPEEFLVGDTCHVDVIDRWGNMVSATPSGGWLSSSPVIPGLGFSLGTRLQMAWLDDRLPGALRPGKRPTTTLSPTLLMRDGEPYAAFGTPGGDQQEQWQTVLLLRHIRQGMGLQQAIDAPAWHFNHFIASFWPRLPTRNLLTLEARFSDDAVARLRARGHDLMVGEPWSEGRLTACAQEHHAGVRILRAAANPRGMQAYAAGR
jgi:gamma-glutamyltranspeptidase / glutathione hydrolase